MNGVSIALDTKVGQWIAWARRHANRLDPLKPSSEEMRSASRRRDQPLDRTSRFVYHRRMPGARVHWTLVFTAASLEHLAERNVEAPDVVDAVDGRHGPARVRRTGRGIRRRWFVMAPLDTGELLMCVLRAALPRDLSAERTFVVSSDGLLEAPGRFDPSMRLCVSARVAMEDEVRSYRRWRVSKGGR